MRRQVSIYDLALSASLSKDLVDFKNITAAAVTARKRAARNPADAVAKGDRLDYVYLYQPREPLTNETADDPLHALFGDLQLDLAKYDVRLQSTLLASLKACNLSDDQLRAVGFNFKRLAGGDVRVDPASTTALNGSVTITKAGSAKRMCAALETPPPPLKIMHRGPVPYVRPSRGMKNSREVYI